MKTYKCLYCSGIGIKEGKPCYGCKGKKRISAKAIKEQEEFIKWCEDFATYRENTSIFRILNE